MRALHVATLLIIPIAGCPNPSGRFDDFVARVPDAARIVQLDGAPLDDIPDVTGDFLLGVSLLIAPDQPLSFDATNTLTQAAGVTTLELRFRARNWMDGAPVGDEITRSAPVSSAGEFELMFDDLLVPAAANPITGSDVAADLVFRGRIIDEHRMCGDIPMGLTTSGIDLAGSTWASVRKGGVLPPLETACPVAMPDAGPPDAAAAPDAGLPDAAAADATP